MALPGAAEWVRPAAAAGIVQEAKAGTKRKGAAISDPAGIFFPPNRWRRRLSGAVSIALALAYAVAAVIVLPETLRVSDPMGANDTSLPSGVPANDSANAEPSRDSTTLEYEAIARYAHGPLARILRRRVHDDETSTRIARALVGEATRLRVAPSLLAAVLITENPRLESQTVSSQGAIGLMQVMPFHAGEYGCPSVDLRNIEGNICHGARVFGYYLGRTKSVESALLRYNGCVASTNTPNCHSYPAKVLRTAGGVRRELLQRAVLPPRRTD